MADEAPIVLVGYDPSWPGQFGWERDNLLRLIRDWLVGPIEHIGSTAVPGLAAKPVIDIVAGVESLEASRSAIPVLCTSGYCYSPYRPDIEHWFCKPSPAFRTHHLHLVPYKSALWNAQIGFRDYLRSHSRVAQEYEELKHDLASRYRDDREGYTDAKGAFVRHILKLIDQGSRSG